MEWNRGEGKGREEKRGGGKEREGKGRGGTGRKGGRVRLIRGNCKGICCFRAMHSMNNY